MAPPPPPPAKKPPPPPKNAKSPAPAAAAISSGSARGILPGGEAIGIYGPGGIGKTELVCSIEPFLGGRELLVVDVDRGTAGLDVRRAMADGDVATSFLEVRAALQQEAMEDYVGAVAIDTFSSLEERIREHVIASVPHEKRDKTIRSIEDYGFGKGYTHIFEQALLILQDLDALRRRGKHVILVCHQCAEKVPSAISEDYLEYQPRLQSPPKSGKLRERVFEWANHFFRLDHDRFVEDGKAAAGDSRSIHTTRTTTAWAKHRTMAGGRDFPDTIPFPKGDTTLWQIMFGEQA